VNTEMFKYIKDKIYWCAIVPLFGFLFRFFPINKNKIFFDNFGGKGYADNPKYIAEEIANRALNIRMVWVVGKRIQTSSFPKYINTVKQGTLRELFERSTSGMWVDNIRSLHPVKKRRGQLYLQTWHGSFSPKKVEKDAESQLNIHYCQEAKYDGSITDAILVNSELLEKQYRRAFWLSENTEYLRVGLPRYDFLVKNGSNHKYISALKKKLGIDSNTYIVLYAPTFRDDESVDGYKIDYNKIISAFKKKVNKDVLLIVRMHPNASKYVETIKFDDRIINGSLIPDLQELSILSDCVITDYSTSLYDFILLKRPIFICALDLDHYQDLRGLLPEYFDLPFRINTSNEELIETIETFEEFEYFKRVDNYFTVHPMYDDGEASARVVDWIERKMH